MSGASLDVTVAGGGIVGATTAALLARCGFSVALVESGSPPAYRAGADVGLRVSAVSPGSQAILREAGAWSLVERHRHCPYRRMHIEDGATDACLAFEAPSHGLERLGTIVENDLLRWALWTALQASPLLTLHCPARLSDVRRDGGGIEAVLDDGTVLRSDLLLAADGPGSPIRRQAGIREDVWEYGQQGLVCVVGRQQPNPGVAWQRFLADGPLAFLPLADGRSSIVWTLPDARARSLLAADDETFRTALDEASEGWLGTTQSLGPRAAFPLVMRLSDRYFVDRIVLLGDAAHVVHPLAGQGVNLGLADAAALVETLVLARVAGDDIADADRLSAWQRSRRSESRLMAGGIHGFGGLFSASWLSPLRRVGLGLVARSWTASDGFVRRAAGVHAQAPLVARGETLAGLLRPGDAKRSPDA